MFARTIDIIAAVLNLKSVLSASFFLLCVYSYLPFVNAVKFFSENSITVVFIAVFEGMLL